MSTLYSFSLFNPVRQVTYFATACLDEGGFGQVWHGVTGQGLEVAIKVIKPSSDFCRDFSSWFTDQEVHLKCLQHPYIVVTFDQFISADGQLVIVMERGGGSLQALSGEGMRWTDKSICAIGIQILAALHYIHGLCVIHRDVTLKNIIWFPEGTFKLCDFGISKQSVQPDEYARTFIGHKSYIPPELHAAGYTTHQSDIYQLGLVLLTLMTGSHPIPESATPEQAREMILDGVPRGIAESLIPSHGKTAEIISVMLRRRDSYRYKSAVDAWADCDAEFRRQETI
jgi:serine/threonine protein kinase